MTRTTIRDLLARQDLVFAPGAWDGLSARLVEQAGFDAVCSSGYAVSASMGMPDIELYTATEALGAVHAIREATDLPIVADIDTGYGNAGNVMRTVRGAEVAGASAVFMEDQLAPKRCPICVGEPVALVPLEEAAGKVRAARDAAAPETVVIARTDAHGDDALRRVNAYVQAGADLIMPVTKTFDSVEEWTRCAKEAGVGLVATLTAGTWVEQKFTPAILREIGVRLALLPNQTVHAAALAIQQALSRLKAGEPPAQVSADAMAHRAFIDMLGIDEALALQAQYLPSPEIVANG